MIESHYRVLLISILHREGTLQRSKDPSHVYKEISEEGEAVLARFCGVPIRPCKAHQAPTQAGASVVAIVVTRSMAHKEKRRQDGGSRSTSNTKL